ncbi:hypothetical protein [Oceanobacillus polygoni]|uniref:Uncharacterized protein n=1 Tax=Oceanobacillus polygoni TaxID=1235259 RepID=A0A9X0YQM2_9BACI|nr:hypothetical protein [Oceanobacillus polygoni]MBP2077115.1 hypothetical protein [Oceanobacillus polygoni]
MKEVEYKLFYKPSGTVWKHFYLNAKNDGEAKIEAKEEMESFNIVRYGVEKITKERIL